MKKSLIIKTLIIAILSVLTFSCTDRFEDINDNPNDLDDKNDCENLLFTGALKLGAFEYTTYQRTDMLHTSFFVQYFANIRPQLGGRSWGTDRYELRSDWYGYFWNQHYANMGSNLYEAMKKDKQDSTKINKVCIERILMVFMFHRLTDLYGDCPYSEAFKGAEGIVYPKYDRQKDIYIAMLKELKEASLGFNTKYNQKYQNFGEADILFWDNTKDFNTYIGKWKKFANSLCARLAMRISDVKNDAEITALARKSFEDAISRGTIVNENIAMPCWATNYNEINPMSLVLGWSESVLSKTFVDYLTKYSDPRKSYYLNDVNKPGMANGRTFDDLIKYDNEGARYAEAANYAMPSSKYYDKSNPIELINYDEICFLKAEAKLKGWGGSIAMLAQDYYEDGIKASLTLRGKASNYNTYIASDSVKWDNSWTYEKKLQKIITQKYLALFPNSMEAYAEWRRTGYPKLNKLKEPKDSLKVPPRRFPLVEIYNNKERVAETKKNQGLTGDYDQSTPVWWDQKFKK